MAQVLSVEVPAPCPYSCSFCRTPSHGEGDMEDVLQAASSSMESHQEIYVTANGETGLSPIFKRLVDLALKKGKSVAVLCASKVSVVPGLKRVEVSLSEFTRDAALRAIEKAKSLGIPVTLSVVDDLSEIDLEALAEEYGVDGVLVRARQQEGLSTFSVGKTRVWKRPGVDLGLFPVAAYQEVQRAAIGHPSTCINHLGKTVGALGGAAS